MDIQREDFEITFQKTSFCKNMVKSLENSDCPFTSVFEMRNGKYRSSHVQLSFEIWQAAKAHEAEKLKGCVVVPLENVRFFSNDGENYQTHETLEEAKHEAECAIEYYSERLADQQLDPRSDGNFQDIGCGIVLAESSYSVDHIVTQQDKDNGKYSYEVGTEIMSLFLLEAVRGGK